MKSIRRQLILTLLPAIVLLAICSGAGLYMYAYQVLTQQFDAGLIAKAKAVAAAISWDDEHPAEIISPDQFAAEFSRQHHPAYFEARWADGVPALRSGSLGKADLPSSQQGTLRPWNLRLGNGRLVRAVEVSFVPAKDADDHAHFLAAGGPTPQSRGQMKIILAQSRGAIDEPLEVLATSLGIAVAMMALGTVLIVAIAVRRSLRPLAAVADAAAANQHDLFDHQFSIDGMPAELVPICGRLNELLGRVQDAYRRERRFTADVAHELRTPIAELKSLAEVSLKFPGDANATELAFRDALASTRQMENIVTTLLSLARSEAGQLRIDWQPVELNDFVMNVWKRFADRAESRGLFVERVSSGAVMIQTDKTLLDVILSNLFSNAMDHSPERSRVTWSLALDADGPVLEVCNSVEHLTVQDVPHFFEPFWQKDSARSDGKHFGLGLALCDSYAKMLGLALVADVPKQNWLRIRLHSATSRGAADVGS